MRECTLCGSDYECFGLRRRICRPCKQAYDRDYHAKRSPEKKMHKVQLQKVRYQDNRKKLYEYLADNPCEVCGEDDPIVLEFDHLDQETKDFTVANMTTHSWETIDREIKKCRVLCANCHRRHTADQLGWYKFIQG